MSCNACTKQYGFFCKEFGCPNCNYSFCKQCLRKVIEVPRCGGAKLNVCLKCFEKLEKAHQVKTSDDAVQKSAENLLESSEAIIILEAPLEPIKIGEENKADNDIAENLDSEISKRLKDLKKSEGEKLPSDVDMASRLANLKGVPYKEYSRAELLSKDTRSEQEQVQDLLAQFLDEKKIDAEIEDPLVQIEKRLAALKGEQVQASTSADQKKTTNTDEEEDDEVKTKKIMEKFIAESQLPNAGLTEEEKEFLSFIPPPTTNTEELPFCTICNEDASIRCKGCDGDLFCAQCFRECHADDDDFRSHERVPYSIPPNFKEDHF